MGKKTKPVGRVSGTIGGGDSEKPLDLRDGPWASSPRAEKPLRAYRIGEAAKVLGVHPSSLRKWEASGDLPAARRRTLGYRFYLETDLGALRVAVRRHAEELRRKQQEHAAGLTGGKGRRE
jgi:hypothetical protein